MSRRAAIVSPMRTPVGKFLGGLSSMNAGQLGAVILKALMERSGIDPTRVDDVVFSQGYGNGEAPAIGHWAWLAAGLPIEVPGFQLDRRCGSGVQAVATAAMMVETGMADVVVAGGVESMSNVEHYTLAARGGVRMGDMVLHDRLSRGRVMSQPVERFGVITGMIETAENLAKDYGITREEADAFAVRSHQNAARAWAENRFAEQLVPVAIPQRKGEPVIFDHDEGYRTDASMETLGKLAPIDLKRDPQAIVTAGNASQQNDAAAACLVVAEDKLEELGLTPMLWFGGWAAAGCDPSRMGIGPVPAVERLFARRGYSWDDIGLVEQIFERHRIEDAAVDHHPAIDLDRHEDGGNRRRRGQLGGPHGGQVVPDLGAIHGRVVDVAFLATGAAHQHCSHTRLGILGKSRCAL